MRRAILLLVSLIVAVLAGVPLASAEKRVALVIGNDAYDEPTHSAKRGERCRRM